MALELKRTETVPAGIRRIIREQIDAAIAQLEGRTHLTRDEAVHEARKCIKKARAALRLVRDELGTTAYAKENARFRDAGRALSSVRDAEVCVRTFESVSPKLAKKEPPERIMTVHHALLSRRGEARERADHSKDRANAMRLLGSVREALPGWKLARDGWAALERGIKQVYRQNREAFATVCDEPTPENYHEWRKQAKYLWYHLRILKVLGGGAMKPLIDEAQQISDLLGDDHDLHVLKTTLLVDADLFGGKANLRGIVKLLGEREREIRKKVRPLARHLHKEKPSEFAFGIGEHWTSRRAKPRAR